LENYTETGSQNIHCNDGFTKLPSHLNSLYYQGNYK
jgi:hypothetical protein